MKTIVLTLPTSDFDILWELADKKGKSCKVSKPMLTALLLDHSRALARLSQMGEAFTEPEYEEITYSAHPKVRQNFS